MQRRPIFEIPELLREIAKFTSTHALAGTCREIRRVHFTGGHGQLTVESSERYLTDMEFRQLMQMRFERGGSQLTLQLSIGKNPLPIEERTDLPRRRFSGPELRLLVGVQGIILEVNGGKSKHFIPELERLRALENVRIVKWMSRVDFNPRLMRRLPASVIELEFHGVCFPPGAGLLLPVQLKRLAIKSCVSNSEANPSLTIRLIRAGSLVALDVSDSSVTDFKFAGGARNLRYLNASRSGITSLAGIDLLTHLSTLDISRCTSIDDTRDLPRSIAHVLI